MNSVLRAASRISAGVVDDDWSTGPRPPARATVHSLGPQPLRVLLFGGGPVVGYGVASHDLALAGHLARELSGVLGYGIDMDVVTDADLRCRDMRHLLAEVDVARYDLVFLSVGVQDALDFAAPEGWAGDVEKVIRMLRPASDAPVPLFVLGVPPVSHVLHTEPHLARILDRRAEQFNERLRALCPSSPATVFVPFEFDLEPDSERHRTSQTYHRWAKLLMPALTPALHSLRRGTKASQNEDARQAALDRLHIVDTPRDRSFDSLAATARRFFGTLGAGISFIDGDRQWFKAISGTDAPNVPRSEAFCNHTIATDNGIAIEDATLDRRFASFELVVNGGIRSYAGVPVRDPHGYAVGAVCVFDDKPRTFTESEMTYLRAVAHLVERQLLVAS